MLTYTGYKILTMHYYINYAMFKLLTSLILALFTSNVFAQTNAKVYAEIGDYRNNTPAFEDVIIQQHTDPDVAITGNIDYDINTANVVHGKKHIKDRSWAVERNDSLFINCQVIKYKRYAPVLYRNDSFIYFRAFMSRLKEHEVQMHIAGKKRMNRSELGASGSTPGMRAAYFGGAGAAIAVSMSKAMKLASERYNYVLLISTGQVKVLDIPMMQQLLHHHPKSDRQYMKEGHPDDPESIIRFLKLAWE